jgi:hypothetical protein
MYPSYKNNNKNYEELQKVCTIKGDGLQDDS